MIKNIRYFFQGCLAYIIAHTHDWYCKHYGTGWVYMPWGTSLKEHSRIVKEYYEDKKND